MQILYNSSEQNSMKYNPTMIYWGFDDSAIIIYMQE